MSQGSYSFARTRSARVARQVARERTASFFYDLAPAMAEPVADRNLSVTYEVLPDFGPWVRAYVAGHGPCYHPKHESVRVVCTPGISARKTMHYKYSL